MTLNIRRIAYSSVVLTLALLALPAIGTGQTSGAPHLPPADSIVANVVRVIGSGNPRERGALIKSAFTARAVAADSTRFDRFLASLHEQGAPFTVSRIERSGRHALVTLASSRARRVATLIVSTDRANPTGLGNIDILSAHDAVLDSLSWPARRPRGDAALVRLVNANMQRLATAGAFSGVVYIATRDSVIYERAFGLADREDSTPNTTRTRFALASMGKMFTATAILRLVDQGRLSLDDTLAEILPRYPNAERARKVTIRHLLSHTAGMGDQWSTPRRPVPGLTGALATVAAVAHPPLMFEPGTQWSYSNEGYNVLAAVIEEVTGSSFKDHVRAEILSRAGMTETVLEGGADDVTPRRAVGYRPAENDLLGAGPPRANWSFIVGASAGGAGGGYSTAEDLARFGRALREGRLIGRAMRDSMWTGRWPIPGFADERYGWGSFVQEVGEHRVVGHGGGGTGSGIDTGFRQFSDGRYTIVVLTNIDPPMATRVTAALVKLLAAPPE
jgi:CubicO group peptidase (beta-lactamase class C family)